MFYTLSGTKEVDMKRTEIHIQIGPDECVYGIRIVSKKVGIPTWTIRTLVKEGFLSPKKAGKKKKLFSLHDIERLQEIRELMEKERIELIKMLVDFMDI